MLLLSLSIKTAFGHNNQNIVFVSSSLGNDNNNGTSELCPVKTINQALQLGNIVYLKCGDVFFENVSLQDVFVSCYGKGPKPVLSGYKRNAKQKWQKISLNVWKTSLVEYGYSGKVVSGSTLENNIGCIHDYQVDSIHGRKVRFREDLKENWDLWQTNNYKNPSPSDFDDIYIYYSGNPNEMCLEFSTGTTGVLMNNSTLENIKIEGFGCHGIAARTRSIIKNCEIDAIGGKIQIGYEVFTSLGNGIEFYVSRDIENCVVQNCKITRCYDCGITIQGSDSGKATPRNILIDNNLIMNCCQGWEDFLRNDSDVVYNNCVFQNNYVLNSGLTSGFSYPPRFKYCHVLGNNFKGNKGMIIKDNVFVGGNYYCSGEYQGSYKSNIWHGNVCYIKRGDYILSNYFGTADVIRIPQEKGKYKSLKAATKAVLGKYTVLTGDQTTKFIITSERGLNRKIRKISHKYENSISKL